MPGSTLSVILQNYNDGATIGEAIEAILNQSFKPTELILVDDGSTDNSVEIIERYAKKDSTIRFLRNERNMGLWAAAYRALEAASGDYLYSASSNDKILPGFFEKSMSLLQQYPQAGLSCSDFFFLFPDSTLVRDPQRSFTATPCYFSPEELISRMSAKRFYVPHGCGVVWKRSSLSKAGNFNAQLGSAGDWFAIHIMAFRDGICYVPEALAVNRSMPDSYSARHGRQPLLQRKIYRYGHSLLKAPEYRDVYDAFQKSGAVLAFFGGTYAAILRTLLAHPEYWKRLFPLLFKRVLKKMRKMIF